MTYAGLMAAYLLAPVVLILLIAFAQRGWSEPEESDEPMTQVNHCDKACGSIWALIKRELGFAQQLDEVRGELKRLKALPMPPLGRWGKLELALEWWLPFQRRAVPWYSWIVVAAWSLVSWASASILALRILANPSLATREVSGFQVSGVPDALWSVAVIMTFAVAIFLLLFGLTFLLAQGLKGNAADFKNWKEVTETTIPSLESKEDWLSGQLHQTRSDLDQMQEAWRKRFGDAIAP